MYAFSRSAAYGSLGFFEAEIFRIRRVPVTDIFKIVLDNFGHNFRITLFGESHGPAVGVVIDGIKAGLPLDAADFAADLARRAPGADGTTSRSEADIPVILSGVYNGFTTGSAIAITFANRDTRSEDYSQFAAHPRPSHADLAASRKYGGFNDPRGGGHASGRLTVGLVAAGAVAKKLIPQTIFDTRIVSVGGCTEPSRFTELIKTAAAEGDSVGGVIECAANGLPAGIGEPFFDSVESVAAHLLFSIPGVKGVEFGAGFKSAGRRGSENNDLITENTGKTATNNDGGVNGGITNGNPLVVRVAVKPTPSISKPQETYNFESDRRESLAVTGRHDACIALRAAVIVEAAMAITLAELMYRG